MKPKSMHPDEHAYLIISNRSSSICLFRARIGGMPWIKRTKKVSKLVPCKCEPIRLRVTSLERVVPGRERVSCLKIKVVVKELLGEAEGGSETIRSFFDWSSRSVDLRRVKKLGIKRWDYDGERKRGASIHAHHTAIEASIFSSWVHRFAQLPFWLIRSVLLQEI